MVLNRLQKQAYTHTQSTLHTRYTMHFISRHYILKNGRLYICCLCSVLKAPYETHLFNMPMGAAACTHISTPCLAAIVQPPTTLLFFTGYKWIHLHRAPVGKTTWESYSHRPHRLFNTFMLSVIWHREPADQTGNMCVWNEKKVMLTSGWWCIYISRAFCYPPSFSCFYMSLVTALAFFGLFDR